MLKLKWSLCGLWFAVCILGTYGFAFGQNKLLYNNVSINVKDKTIADLLLAIGKQGGFYFSYGNNMIATDSVVSISARNQTVKSLLDEVFQDKVDYKEAPGYIILRPAPFRLSVHPDNFTEPDNTFIISGYVVDEITGAKLANASVYEKQLLISTLTDRNGYFKLKIKHAGAVTLTVSKELYRDTSVNLLNTVRVYSNPDKYYYSDDSTGARVDRSWFGRFFVSSKLKVQSLNLDGFIANMPVQVSIIPSLSTHGLMSGQVVNRLSVNIFGGYNEGVNGVELGGIYNINKQDVQYLQAAGLFNIAGRNLRGIQLAGISNTVYENVDGFQAAPLYNKVKGDLYGAQLAGIVNYVKGNSKGFQAAAGMNITGKEAKGFQMAGLFNKAHILNGVHISPLNIADTLSGIAIGLVNIARNGYHQLSFYTDEVLTTGISFKTGNAKLYTRLIAGVSFTDSIKFYSYGIAFGHDFKLNKRLMLSAEGSLQTLQSGKWKNQHQLTRFSTLLNMNISPKLGFFIGPSFSLYSEQRENGAGSEQAQLTRHKLFLMNFSNDTKGWIGWRAGINLL
jgi:hypothetical protein